MRSHFSWIFPYLGTGFYTGFSGEIIGKFVRTYEAGGANPCIDCNRFMKFDKLLDFAEQHGLYYVVTGHYAALRAGQTDRPLAAQRAWTGKDQSYVLYTMTQRQLAPQISAGRPQQDDPQAGGAAQLLQCASTTGYLLLPDGGYVKFMEQYTPGKHYPAGDFLDLDGKPVGKHKVLSAIQSARDAASVLRWESRLYVCGKDMEKNTVSVGPEAALFSDTVNHVIALNWLRFKADQADSHQGEDSLPPCGQPVTVSPMEDSRVKLVFDDEPQSRSDR